MNAILIDWPRTISLVMVSPSADYDDGDDDYDDTRTSNKGDPREPLEEHEEEEDIGWPPRHLLNWPNYGRCRL